MTKIISFGNVKKSSTTEGKRYFDSRYKWRQGHTESVQSAFLNDTKQVAGSLWAPPPYLTVFKWVIISRAFCPKPKLSEPLITFNIIGDKLRAFNYRLMYNGWKIMPINTAIGLLYGNKVAIAILHYFTCWISADGYKMNDRLMLSLITIWSRTII